MSFQLLAFDRKRGVFCCDSRPLYTRVLDDKLLTNRAADTDIILELPPPVAGLIYQVQVHKAMWLTLRVSDPVNELIRVSALECKAVKSQTVGDTLTLIGGSETEWFVHGYVGAWIVMRDIEVKLRAAFD